VYAIRSIQFILKVATGKNQLIPELSTISDSNNFNARYECKSQTDDQKKCLIQLLVKKS